MGKVVKLEDLIKTLESMGLRVAEDKVQGILNISNPDLAPFHPVDLYYGLAVRRTRPGCKGYHDVEE